MAEEQQAAPPIPGKGHGAAAACPDSRLQEARDSKATTAAMPSLGLFGLAAAESGWLRIKCHVPSSKKNHSAEHKRSSQNKGMKNPSCGLGRIKVMCFFCFFFCKGDVFNADSYQYVRISYCHR